MNGEAASANQRLGVARNDALQGATLAFQHSRDPSPNVRATNVRASSSTMASDHRPLGRQRTGSDAPEVGSVKDKIGRLARPLSPPASTSLSVRGRTPAASPSSASQIAARLAASRSPGRDTSVPSTTARLGAGAIRSASRVPPSPEKRQLPAPTPLRSIQGREAPLDRMLHENGLKSDSDLPIYGRSPSQQSRATLNLSLIHISEPTRRTPISYAVFCLKKKSMPSSA